MHPLGVVPKAKVDCWQSALGFMMSIFLSVDYVDWISQTGGGTLSAPTGCSPRDCGRLLAVDYSLKEYILLFFLDSTSAGRSSGIRTGGGTLSAPTGCSPRDYGGLLAVDHGLSIYCLCCFLL